MTLFDTLFHANHSINPLEDTIERVTGAIRARLLSPGDRLPAERDLALQLGVSRSTLRVALQALTDAGWLEVRRGRNGGSFVARWPLMPQPHNLHEILKIYQASLPALLDFRQAVETSAAWFAAERATAQEIEQLQAIVQQMHDSASNFETYRTADARFHTLIAQASHSPRIIQAVTETQAALANLLDVMILHTIDTIQRASSHHQAILDAIRDRNPVLAHAMMHEHVRATENVINSLFEVNQQVAGGGLLPIRSTFNE